MKQWCTNYKFSQNEFASRYSTQSYIYTWHVFFAHLSFRPMTQPNPPKTNFRPIPDPTQPNPRVNPTHGQLCCGNLWANFKEQLLAFWITLYWRACTNRISLVVDVNTSNVKAFTAGVCKQRSSNSYVVQTVTIRHNNCVLTSLSIQNSTIGMQN